MAELIGFKALIVSENNTTYVLTPEESSSLSTIYMPKASLALTPAGGNSVQYIYGKPEGEFTIVTSATSDRTHSNVAGTFKLDSNGITQSKTLSFQDFLDDDGKDVTGDTRQRTDLGLGVFP